MHTTWAGEQKATTIFFFPLKKLFFLWKEYLHKLEEHFSMKKPKTKQKKTPTFLAQLKQIATFEERENKKWLKSEVNKKIDQCMVLELFFFFKLNKKGLW